MGIFNFIKTHKMSVLSSLLVVAAGLLGADLGFAMAVDPVELSPAANPSENMDTYDASANPGGRPADEALQTDEQGGKTQLQGKAATATDVRDAGLERDRDGFVGVLVGERRGREDGSGQNGGEHGGFGEGSHGWTPCVCHVGRCASSDAG